MILFGRSRKPMSETVRAVQGIKGEPATPEDPSLGPGLAINHPQIDLANAQDEYTWTADLPDRLSIAILGASAAVGRLKWRRRSMSTALYYVYEVSLEGGRNLCANSGEEEVSSIPHLNVTARPVRDWPNIIRH